MSQIRKSKKRKFVVIDQQKQALDNLAVISEQDFIFEAQVTNPQNNYFSNYEASQKIFPKISNNAMKQNASEELSRTKIKYYHQGLLSGNNKKNYSQQLMKKKTFQQQLFNAFKNQQEFTTRSPNRFNKNFLGITNFMLFDARCKSSEPTLRAVSKVQKQIANSKINHIKKVTQNKQKYFQSQKNSATQSKLLSKYSRKSSNSPEVKVIQKIDDKLKQKFSKLSNQNSLLSQKAKEAEQKGKKIYIQLQNPIKLSKVPLHQYYKKYVL